MWSFEHCESHDILFELKMSILYGLVSIVFGALLFLFMYWRRLREDYSGSLIFSSGFTFIVATLVGILVFGLISNFIPDSQIFDSSESWFWGAFMGNLVALVIVKNKFKLKTVETFEADILGLLSWMCVVYAHNLELRLFAACLLLISFFYFIDNRYRSFHWYKSGRVGFSGLLVAGIFFLSKMLLALATPGFVSSVGKVDILLSAVSAFLLFFSLYNLGELD